MPPPFDFAAARTPAALEVYDGPTVEGLADVALAVYGMMTARPVTFAAWVLELAEDQVLAHGSLPAGRVPAVLVLPDGRRVGGVTLGGAFRVGHYTIRGADLAGPARTGPVAPGVGGPFDE